MSRRFSSRVTVSCSGSPRATPRGSKVRHTQPSAAISRARARYCSWPLPQPCTNNTPGIAVAGATSVPGMLRPSSTGISIGLSRLDMVRLSQCVLRHWSISLVLPPEVHRRMRRRLGLAVNLHRAGAYRVQPGVGAKRLQCRDLGAARATDAPGLLQHAAAQPPSRVQSPGNVVVAAGGEHTSEAVHGCLVVHPRLRHREPRVLWRIEYSQGLEITPRDDQVGAA